MSKSIYSYIGDQWKSPSKEHKALQKDRLFHYRREDATVKVEKPTRIDRAELWVTRPNRVISWLEPEFEEEVCTNMQSPQVEEPKEQV